MSAHSNVSKAYKHSVVLAERSCLVMASELSANQKYCSSAFNCKAHILVKYMFNSRCLDPKLLDE